MTEVCRSAYYHIGQIGKIRRFLTRDACVSAARSAILSRIDYSNALVGGLAVTQLARLQRVQNMAARLIALKPKNDSITPVLCDWLPVKLRIVFKLCTCIRDFTILLQSTSPMNSACTNQEDLYDLEILEQCSPLLQQTKT